MPHPDTIIPENNKGAQSDTESSITLPTRDEALKHYQLCKKRLLEVSNWQELAGSASAKFELTDAKGEIVNRQVSKGDYFKIDIPAPGTDTGDGFDWVNVENIEEDQNITEGWEFILIKVRPAQNPNSPDPNTSHFFKDDANSYFLVKREGNKVSAQVHGRNEKPNTDTNSITDKIRNTLVAIGAMLGISKAQWKSLTDGLIAK